MNISSLKTPGVYINEIDAFPPSVAQVATAIPAFIGYTEKGDQMKPTRIKSLLEFEDLFGGAPRPASIDVEMSADGIPTDNCNAKESKYKLYNSMRLFYSNGGGSCYIVSVGYYKDAITKNKFTEGIDKLKKEDEPTLLLFPDAVNLLANELGEVQVAALQQCEKRMDRFVIMDVQYNKATQATDIDNFRQHIGTANLKYGAAYYPYLRTSFPHAFKFTDIDGALKARNGVGMKALFGVSPEDVKLKSDIDAFLAMSKFISDLKAAWKLADQIAQPSVISPSTLKNSLEKCWGLLAVFGKPDNILNSINFKNYFNNEIISNKMLPLYAQKLTDLLAAYNGLQEPDPGQPTGVDTITPLALTFDNTRFNGNWGNSVSTMAASATNYYEGRINTEVAAVPSPPPAVAAYDTPNFPNFQSEISKLRLQIINGAEAALSLIDMYAAKEENDLISRIPVYAQIIAKLNRSMNEMPPSGAIAGVYAQTDASRGVWKAPANVSINGLIDLTVDIDDDDQAEMNIHESGKSVNAIRRFTGEGFLVWGARTLDGNSNDWRYVNVRRLANMVEESVKKACKRYMFEPNVAQTWVNVKGMIENYLTNLWNDGGLAGAKPEHAFFVAVGINQTMTGRDVQEGKMIIKVGICPSRPAEFIILNVTQMMQRS